MMKSRVLCAVRVAGTIVAALVLLLVIAVSAKGQEVGSKLQFPAYCYEEEAARELAESIAMHGDVGYRKSMASRQLDCFDVNMHAAPPMILTLKERVFKAVHEDGRHFQFWRAEDRDGTSGYVWTLILGREVRQ